MERQTGKTTRIIDAAVQTLFTTGHVKVVDHNPNGSNYAYQKLMQRLRVEHAWMMDRQYMQYDNKKLTVTLTPEGKKKVKQYEEQTETPQAEHAGA